MYKVITLATILYATVFYSYSVYGDDKCPLSNSKKQCMLGSTVYARMCSCNETAPKACFDKFCEECVLDGEQCGGPGSECCPRWAEADVDGKGKKYQIVESVCPARCEQCGGLGDACHEIDQGTTATCCGELKCICGPEVPDGGPEFRCGIPKKY